MHERSRFNHVPLARAVFSLLDAIERENYSAIPTAAGELLAELDLLGFCASPAAVLWAWECDACAGEQTDSDLALERHTAQLIELTLPPDNLGTPQTFLGYLIRSLCSEDLDSTRHALALISEAASLGIAVGSVFVELERLDDFIVPRLRGLAPPTLESRSMP